MAERRLLQFSDVHFGVEHKRACAAALEYAHATPSDLILITGDITQKGLPDEFAAAAGWESGKTCTTDDVRTLAKKDAKLSGTALAECVILDLRGETIAPEIPHRLGPQGQHHLPRRLRGRPHGRAASSDPVGRTRRPVLPIDEQN